MVQFTKRPLILCRPTKPKLGRSVFAGFLIPSVEMLVLMQGTFPLKHFC
jgi:hypothetical protein